MLRRTELTEFLELSKDHDLLLVFEQLPGDTITPISAAAGLLQHGYKISLLESGESVARIGRYSFLGFDPEEVFFSNGSSITLRKGDSLDTFEAEPFTFFRDHQSKNRVHSSHHIPGFLGGYVGYLSYDGVRYFEEIPDRHHDELGFPEMYIEWHRKGIVFDHEAGILTLVLMVHTEGNAEDIFLNARKEIEAMKGLISRPVIDHDAHKESSPVETDVDDDAYVEIVNKCREYIRQGDAFQIVPSRSFTKKTEKHPFSIYRSLRLINPSPYMFYLDTSHGVILGASPEKLVSAVNGELETIPLAGTRAKKGVEYDDAIQKELLSDQKELAEHMMLVDLGRNDLGRVSAFGTVHVQQLCSVLQLSHVMHLASVVRGTLDKSNDVFDVLRAVFPAGTLSGAPKVRAMEIIDELEKSKRGPYGGAILMIDPLGNLDSCIAIRMAIIKDNIAHMRAGAGVVFDSIPENEVQETWAKVQVLLDAIDA